MKINFKQVFIFIIVGLLASACEDSNSVGPEEHTDADGLVLEHDGQELYKEFEGAILFNNLTLNVGETLELSVHFLDLYLYYLQNHIHHYNFYFQINLSIILQQ